MSKATKIFIAVWVLIILIPITIQITKKVNRDRYARYTIGVTNGVFFGNKAANRIKFSFTVAEKLVICEDTYHYRDEAHKTGGRYFVRFDSLHPSNAVLLQDFPVPDSIKTAPPNGWKEIPVKKPEN